LRLAFGIDLLLDQLQYLRRKVVSNVLGVQRQNQAFVVAKTQGYTSMTDYVKDGLLIELFT
jgi:hypothetical protein